MSNVLCILRRELSGYFATPVAYVFLVIFLALAGVLTFQLGDLLESGQADLQPFFAFHPWLYMFLVPAISMRLWAEERKQGTLEVLLTLPISMGEAVLGKFLAAWLFTAIALALTLPLWLTINWLGSPDNGVIFASYVGSLLMAGSYLAVGACFSALTRNQVIAFVLTVMVCFLFVLAGMPPVLNAFHGWAPQGLVQAIASISFLTHFDAITKGIIDVRDLVFFLSTIGFWLFANAIVIDLRKAE
jgi:ABC-2 type transport system permease protein